MATGARRFSLISLLLIPSGIALNFVLGSLAKALNLPIFLDSVGTILAAILGGPLVGAVTGFLGVLSISLFAPSAVVWSLQAGAIGAITGLLAMAGWFRGLGRTTASTLVIIVASVAGSSIISYLVFGGFDGYGIGVVRAVLVNSGMPLTLAIFITSLVAEVIDKTISVAVPMIVVGRMSDRMLNLLPMGPRLRQLRTEAAVPEQATGLEGAGPTIPADGAGPSTPGGGAGPATGGYGSYQSPAARRGPAAGPTADQEAEQPPEPPADH